MHTLVMLMLTSLAAFAAALEAMVAVGLNGE
jgi:hypothetical protein